PQQGPSRAAGALVVLIDGLCVAHLTRWGKTVTTFFDQLHDGIEHAQALEYVYCALMSLLSTVLFSQLVIEKANGPSIFDSTMGNQVRARRAGISPRRTRLATKTAAPRVPNAPGARREHGTTHALGTFEWEVDAEPDTEAPSPRRGRSIN